jgi:hypothetical protein
MVIFLLSFSLSLVIGGDWLIRVKNLYLPFNRHWELVRKLLWPPPPQLFLRFNLFKLFTPFLTPISPSSPPLFFPLFLFFLFY